MDRATAVAPDHQPFGDPTTAGTRLHRRSPGKGPSGTRRDRAPVPGPKGGRSTNSEHILSPIIEKSRRDDVAIHLVHLRDGDTRALTLEPEQLPELLEFDPMANTGRFLEE